MCGVKGRLEGGALYASSDAGATWTDLLDVDPPGATMGTATNGIGSVGAPHQGRDKSAIGDADARHTGQHQRISTFSGGNHFAYGVDGRWEIIAAQTVRWSAAQLHPLDLLRGRCGTSSICSAIPPATVVPG